MNWQTLQLWAGGRFDCLADSSDACEVPGATSAGFARIQRVVVIDWPVVQVPYGDAFYTRLQIWAQRHAAGQTRLRISGDMCFRRKLLLSSIIRRSTFEVSSFSATQLSSLSRLYKARIKSLARSPLRRGALAGVGQAVSRMVFAYRHLLSIELGALYEQCGHGLGHPLFINTFALVHTAIYGEPEPLDNVYESFCDCRA